MQTLTKNNTIHHNKLPARTKGYRGLNISPGVVSLPNGRLCLTNGIHPRHPYAGMHDTRRASKVTIRRFDQPRFALDIRECERPGDAHGRRKAPMRTSQEGAMRSVVFPNRTIALVIVVNPRSLERDSKKMV